jgi:hypothetical protein
MQVWGSRAGLIPVDPTDMAKCHYRGSRLRALARMGLGMSAGQ